MRRQKCSGLAASWCPNHGDCACPDDRDGTYDGPSLNDPACPLHAPASTHAEPQTQGATR